MGLKILVMYSDVRFVVKVLIIPLILSLDNDIFSRNNDILTHLVNAGKRTIIGKFCIVFLSPETFDLATLPVGSDGDTLALQILIEQ